VNITYLYFFSWIVYLFFMAPDFIQEAQIQNSALLGIGGGYIMSSLLFL
jgi:hypothetical protein